MTLHELTQQGCRQLALTPARIVWPIELTRRRFMTPETWTRRLVVRFARIPTRVCRTGTIERQV